MTLYNMDYRPSVDRVYRPRDLHRCRSSLIRVFFIHVTEYVREIEAGEVAAIYFIYYYILPWKSRVLTRAQLEFAQ